MGMAIYTKFIQKSATYDNIWNKTYVLRTIQRDLVAVGKQKEILW